MATIPKNLPWHDKREVKKGDYGETLIKNLLEKHGYVIYSPVTDSSHCLDMFAYDGEQLLGVEVKTKPMCRKYPETGFDTRSYECYKKISAVNNLPVLVAFVDEDKCAIYGNYLSEFKRTTVVAALGTMD